MKWATENDGQPNGDLDGRVLRSVGHHFFPGLGRKGCLLSKHGATLARHFDAVRAARAVAPKGGLGIIEHETIFFLLNASREMLITIW